VIAFMNGTVLVIAIIAVNGYHFPSNSNKGNIAIFSLRKGIYPAAGRIYPKQREISIDMETVVKVVYITCAIYMYTPFTLSITIKTLFYLFFTGFCGFNIFTLFLRGMQKLLGLMILLTHLKFCWCILNFAGMFFEVTLRQ
jgi:hypothetical protein